MLTKNQVEIDCCFICKQFFSKIINFYWKSLFKEDEMISDGKIFWRHFRKPFPPPNWTPLYRIDYTLMTMPTKQIEKILLLCESFFVLNLSYIEVRSDFSSRWPISEKFNNWNIFFELIYFKFKFFKIEVEPEYGRLS